MTNIEDDLKALIDGTTWTVGAPNNEGITKTTYIKKESENRNLDLDQPVVTSTAVVFVIHPSVRNQLSKSFGAAVYQWNGDLWLFAFNKVDIQNANTHIKTIGDSDINLTLLIPGIDRKDNSDYFFEQIVFQWNKFESDT